MSHATAWQINSVLIKCPVWESRTSALMIQVHCLKLLFSYLTALCFMVRLYVNYVNNLSCKLTDLSVSVLNCFASYPSAKPRWLYIRKTIHTLWCSTRVNSQAIFASTWFKTMKLISFYAFCILYQFFMLSVFNVSMFVYESCK